MLTLVLFLAVAQSDVPPAASTAPVPADAPLTAPPAPPLPPPEFKPNTMGRKANFFSAPQVGPGALVGRVGMSVVGTAVGGGLGALFLLLGEAISILGGGSAAPLIIAAPFAIAALGLGAALGAALFGADYGKDLGDAVAVGLVFALVSVTAVLITLFVMPSLLLPVALGALALTAVATPLMVQVLKPPRDDAPQPTLALAQF